MIGRKTIALLIFSICFVIKINAQNPKFSGWGRNYTTVSSYDGAFELAAFQVRIEKTGFLELLPGWKISVRAIPTPAKNGKIFPVEKLYLQPYFLSGAANDPGPLPALSQLGINSATYLQNNSEVYLIPSSPAKLYNKGTYNSYFDFLLQLNFVVSGGSYLNNLKDSSWPEYPVRFEFKLYDTSNSLIGSMFVDHKIQVSNNLTGTPPVENNFSLLISNNAKEGLLEVKSMADYINGTNVTYNNGVTVSSNTAYQLTVKSQMPEFKSEAGQSLPLDVVKVQLLPEGNSVALSNTPRILFKGSSTNSQPKYFDLKYSSNANDVRLFQAEVENYKTTLTYEITVQ